MSNLTSDLDYFGGSGVDTLRLSGDTVYADLDASSVSFFSSAPAASGVKGLRDWLNVRKIAHVERFENLVGTGGDDHIFGDVKSNYLDGGAGNDVIAGRGGGDVLKGGEGSDAVYYADSQSGVWLDLAEKVAVVPELNARDQVTEFEDVVGSRADDVMAGSAAANWLAGSGGNDVIAGRGGTDTLSGGSGDDTLVGGEGDDILVGDGEGTNGITGRDTFAFSPGSGRDRIDDFEQGKDAIDLSGYANIHSIGDLRLVDRDSGRDLGAAFTEVDIGASNGDAPDLDILIMTNAYSSTDFIFA